MKRIITTLLLMCAVSFGYAQYYQISVLSDPGNPGGLNIEGDQASFNNGNWASVLASGATAYSAPTSIPFVFNFNGVPVTDFVASPTGFLTFDVSVTGAPPSSPQSLPSFILPDMSVCAAWGVDLSGANDAVITQRFGTSPNQQFWILWRSASTPGQANATTYNYLAVVLEETTNNIYLVDLWQMGSAPNMTLGVQIDPLTAEEITGSPLYQGVGNGSDNPSDNDYYIFIPGIQPMYDLFGQSVDMVYWQDLTAAPITVMGTVANWGSQTITSFDINWDDGSGVVTGAVTGNIAPGGNYQYTAPMGWTPPSEGPYTITAWATNLNGNPDGNTANDIATKTFFAYDGATATTRLPLHESFTSSTCPPCLPANILLHGLIDNQHDVDNEANNTVTLIEYPMTWPGTGDPYHTTEGSNRRTYYNMFNSIPQMFVDGGFNANTNAYSRDALDFYTATPAYLSMSSQLVIDIPTQTLSGQVTISPIRPLNNTNLVLHIAVIEKTTFQNVKSNGETVFSNVMKKMIPNDLGTIVSPLEVGTDIIEGFNYTFEGDYRLPPDATLPINHMVENSVEEFSDLTVLAWLQDRVTWEVFQSSYSVVEVKTSTTNIEAGSNGFVGMFPNPASNLANVRYQLSGNHDVSLEVYNVLGKMVYSEKMGNQGSGVHTTIVNTQDFADGVYMVKLEIDNEVYAKKLTVR